MAKKVKKFKINKQAKIENSKREYLKLAVLGIFFIVIIFGASYGFLSTLNEGRKAVDVVSGTLAIEYEDGNNINLTNASPLSDKAGMETNSYTFSIKNTGTLDGKYNIILEEKDTNTLDRKYVKYSIKQENGQWSTPAYLNTGLTLTSNKVIIPQEYATYELKMWLDENAPNEVQGQKYEVKIVVNTVQTNATIEDVEIPIIVLNGNSVVNIEKNQKFVDPGISVIKDQESIDIDKATIKYEYSNGVTTIPVDNVDTSKVGTYYIYYSATDSKNNTGITVRTVNVYEKDTTPPTIALIGDETVVLGYGEKYVELGVVADDDKDDDVNDKIITQGKVNSEISGVYVIKYIVIDSNGNTASTTRQVIVKDKYEDLEFTVEKEETSIIKNTVYLNVYTESDTASYAVITHDGKPTDSEYVVLNNKENNKFSTNIELVRNGKYTIWVKDGNNKIKSKEVTVTNIDETKPVCTFSKLDYIGIDTEKEITLTCTDPADITDKSINKDSFKINSDVVQILDVTKMEKIENGYIYTLNLKAVSAGEVDITLPANTINDKAGNLNEEATSNKIKVSTISVEKPETTIDISEKNEYKINVTGSNMGKVTYASENENIATVTADGVIKGINPGKTQINLIENNGNSRSEIIVYIEKTLTATFVKNGTGVVSIGSESATCKLTYTNPDKCDIIGPQIDVKEGYTALGWNTDKNSHESSKDVSLTDNATFYSISKKNTIVLTANFNNNGATLSDEKSRSCELVEVYNSEKQATSCKVTTPTITGSSNTPIVLGFSYDKPGATEANIASGGELELTEENSNHIWYAITRNDAITYETIFEKNSDGVKELGSTKLSCTIPITYNGIAQDTSCEITLPTITTNDGYTALGWNEDRTSHEASLEGANYTISKNTTMYAILRKDEIVYTANFVKNGLGVTSIGATNASCTLGAVYNNEAQETSCKIELPTIEVEGLWKVLGWSEDSLTHTEYARIEDGITLTKQSTTLYPITKKDTLILDATFNANGATLSTNEGVSCTLPEVYNNEERNDYCVLTTPEVTRENFDFIGFNQDKDSHKNDESYDKEANQIKLDVNNTGKVWNTITKRDLTVKYNKNGVESITKETDSCTIWNSATTCEITLPDITRNTFDIIGWNIDKDATIDNTDIINTLSKIQINDNMTYYAITKKDVVITFNKNGSYAQTNSDGSISYTDTTIRNCTIKNSEDTCSITSPSIIAGTITPTILGYGISSDAKISSWNVFTIKNVTDSETYYAVTKNSDITYNAEFIKQGLGVTGITSTQASCTIPATYNGKIQPTSCNITLPTINVEEGYTALGWNENKDATTGITNSVDIKENKTYYAISKKDEVILTGTFYKNGAASQTYSLDGGIKTSTNEKVEVSCKLEEKYNDNVQETTCVINSPIIAASQETPEIIGYAESKMATIKDVAPNSPITITRDVTYYAITKKSSVTFNAFFDENNSKLSSKEELSCTIGATYNGEKQSESCNVNAPSIEANANTPVIVGFNTNSNSSTNNESYNLETEKLTLNKDNTNSTWYAITKKNTVTYKVNYKIGDHVTSIAKTSGKCVIPETYNGTKQTTVCIIREDDAENNPEITPNVGYTSIGWSQLSSSTVGSPAVVLSKDDMTFYAHAQANPYNINYVSDNAIINTMSVTYDEPFTLKTIKQLNLTKRGYVFNSWTSEGVTYQDGAKVTENLETEANADVYFHAVWDDVEKPTCRFIQVGSTTTQNTTLVKMECTDTGSGVKQKTLTPNDFKVSNGNGVIDSVSAPTQITDGYSYDLTVRGISVGSFDITIPAGIITDNWNNPIVEAKTPNSVIVNGRVYTINYTKGANVDEIGATSGSCITEGSSIVCNVILPSITASKGYTPKGWLNARNEIPAVGTSYQLTEATTGETLTATSHDITPPKCSISGNPTNWTQSAVLTVSATDDGSGLADSPYSWTSKTTGFTTTTTKTITTNGEHKAYAKDKSGNVGECSVTATKIDTTKPACEFSNISDTTIVSGNTATLQLTCTDTQSLINTSTNTLSTSNFTLSSTSAKITSVSAPTAVTNGYKYTVTVQGVSYGAFTVSLNANVMKDNASNYNSKTTSASMTSFNKATTGSCNTLTYNGTAQTLASGGTGITFANNSQTNANTYTVTMTPASQYKFSDEAASKTLSCSIAKKSVTITAGTSSKTYDGKALTNTTTSVTSGSLVSGHTVTPNITGTITDVGSTTNILNSVVIKSGTTDVTANYNVTKANGKLTVNKRATTCTSATTSKVYDGKALTSNSGTCTNLVSGESPVFVNSGTITNVGSTTNTISSISIKSSTKDVTNNYTITKATGTLSVTKANPTISLSDTTKTYNGSAQGVSATVNSGGALSYTYYTNNTCTTQTTTATGASAAGKAPIDAGTYYAKATAAATSNYNSGTSSCVKLTINKKSLSVTWGATTTFTMNSTAQAPTASVTSGVTGETVNVTRTTATAVGNHTSTASISSVTGGRAKTANYTLTNNTRTFVILGITYTATYNANSATISGGKTSCTTTGTNTSCSVTAPTITRTGYTVKGWNTSSTATTASVSSGGSITLNSTNTGKTWYAITVDDIKPSTPSISSVTNNATSLVVKFTGGTDSGSKVARHVCSYGTTSSVTTSVNLATTANSCTFSTSTGTTYYYRICTYDNANNYSCTTVQNTKTWTGIPSGTYTTGNSVSYGGQTWKVVKDNGSTTTLILASNYTTGSYNSASTSINSMISNNATYNYDKSLSKLTGAGLPSRTTMPSNGSNTPFWSSTSGYILGSNGSTSGYSYTSYSLGGTRYYTNGVTAAYDRGLSFSYSTSTYTTATADANASSITLTNSNLGSAVDTIYTSSVKTGTLYYTSSANVGRSITDVLSIRYSDTYSGYASKYKEYSAYVANDVVRTYHGGSDTQNIAIPGGYCHMDSGVVGGSIPITSTSAVYTENHVCTGCNHSCRNACLDNGLKDTADACHNSHCNTKAKALKTFKQWYGTMSYVNPGNWSTGSGSYTTVSETDCKKATYYGVSNGSVAIGIRPVITVAER